MIKKYNDISLAIGIPGLILQIYGIYNDSNVIIILGIVFFIAGLALYAKAKARSPAWGLCGFLSIFGFIILASLSDESKDTSVPKGISFITKTFITIFLLSILFIIAILMLSGTHA